MQSTTEPRVQWLEEQLRGLGLSDGPAATGLVLGSLCLGQFSLDNNWCVDDAAALHPPSGVALPQSSEQCLKCRALARLHLLVAVESHRHLVLCLHRMLCAPLHDAHWRTSYPTHAMHSSCDA
jgi:hypothetical protein